MRRIDHSNIIHLYEVHETDNTVYMIMELLDGGQLLEMFKSQKKVDICSIFIQMIFFRFQNRK